MKKPPPSSQTGRDFGPAPEIGLATVCLKNIVRFVFPFASPVLFRGTAGGENEKQMGQADTPSNSLSSTCGSSVSSGIRHATCDPESSSPMAFRMAVAINRWPRVLG